MFRSYAFEKRVFAVMQLITRAETNHLFCQYAATCNCNRCVQTTDSVGKPTNCDGHYRKIMNLIVHSELPYSSQWHIIYSTRVKAELPG